MSAPVSRRTFLRVGSVAGGGLVLSFGWQLPSLEAAQASAPASLQPNGFVRHPDGKVTIWSRIPTWDRA
jgi:hypothetical protein